MAKIKEAKLQAAAKGIEFEMPTLPCTDCVNIAAEDFDTMVLNSPVDLLVEFYSPMCGHCQHIAPKYDRVATLLETKKANIVVARMDITMNKIPPSGVDAGFAVTGYPAMYLVLKATASHPRTLMRYSGEHEVASIIQWLKQQPELTAVLADVRAPRSDRAKLD
jgi:thioredoxin-like negative regulator of GroEL